MSIPRTDHREPPATGRFRVGIVGLGRIGHHHARSLDVGVLTAGLDYSAGARSTFADRFAVPTYAPTDADTFFADVDAVIICVPNAFHEEYAVDALARGVHVLLEKPLAHTLASAERIADAADRSDAVCTVGFNNRFATAVGHAKTAIDAGDVGRVTHIETNYMRSGGAPDGWFTDPDVAGGGAFLDLGVHALDVALYLLGHPTVIDVTGVTHPADADVEDTAHAFVTTADWRTIAVNASWDAPIDDYNITIHGTDDRLTFDLLDDPTDTYVAEHRAFEAAIAAGDPGDVETALAVQRVISRVYARSDPAIDPVTEPGETITIEVDTPEAP